MPEPELTRGEVLRSSALARGILIGMGLLAGLAVLGALEWFVRVRLDVYRCDAVVGWTFEPHATGLKRNRHGEFSERVAFNSQGFHDAERTLEKPERTYRILVLGDSFAASLQVPRERSFVARLERQLEERRRAGRGLEVINLSVDGFGTAQELLLFRSQGHRYEPDLVLLQVFIDNDVTDNSHAAGTWNHYLATRCGRPYFVLRRGEASFLEGPRAPSNPSRLDRLLRHSQLYASLVSAPVPEGEEPVFHNHDLFVADPPPALWEAWALTQRLILELRDEVAARGARFAVLVSPDKRAVGQLTERQAARDFRYDRGHELLESFLREADIPHLDLLPPLRAQLESGRLPYFAVDSHLNQEGHDVAGKALVDWLVESCATLALPLEGCGAPLPSDEVPPGQDQPTRRGSAGSTNIRHHSSTQTRARSA